LVGGEYAHAAIQASYQFNGQGNWSLDAVGSNSDPVGTVQAVIPLGSTIEKAFLYSAKYTNLGTLPTVELDGTTYGPAAWTPLGVNLFLQAYRADVTTQMQARLNGGSAAPVNLSVRELSDNVGTDGEVLAIVYRNAAEQERTIAFLDGFASSAADTTTVNFANPVNTGVPGFEALLSLGIGFGFQPAGQFSTVDYVDVGSRRLTSSAGGQDDGGGFNGGLITVGGIGDSPTNPNPAASDAGGPRTDDELYNLALGNSANAAPFLTNGTTSFDLNTSNPSNNDLVFFVGINVTARAGVDQPPPSADVPEPAAILVWCVLGMLGTVIGVVRRRGSGTN
jgi:hypothetical protein